MSDGRDRLTDLVAAIRADITQALGGRRRVALLNYPDISNVGDPALWLGIDRTLTDVGVEVVWIGTARDLDVSSVLAADPEAILLNGGGNFGDLWPGQQQARERLLAARPGVPIVQLPQSVHFDDPDNELRNVGLWEAIEEPVMMWREPQSFGWGRSHLPNARHVLTHDAAFGLGPLPAMEAADDVVFLRRRDKESRTPDELTGLPGTDWLVPDDDDPTVASERRRITALRESNAPVELLLDRYRALAHHRLGRGLRLLSAGRVVVTDRLHGVILSALIGRPVIALDNSYGKVHGVVRHSMARWPGVGMASDPGTALAVARSWAAGATIDGDGPTGS